MPRNNTLELVLANRALNPHLYVRHHSLRTPCPVPFERLRTPSCHPEVRDIAEEMCVGKLVTTLPILNSYFLKRVPIRVPARGTEADADRGT